MAVSLRGVIHGVARATVIAVALAMQVACSGKVDSSPAIHADSVPAATAQEPDTNRNIFWSRFREAVLQSDTAALFKLTDRPFSTRGPMDGMPWIARDSAAFVAVLDSLLQADPGLTPAPSTMRELVRSTTALDGKVQSTPDEFRVGEFVFIRGARGWRFAKAYLPE